jgi:hypothetical protein
VSGSKSAHWWRHRLASENRFGDPEWVILRVEIDGLKGAHTYPDMWSQSGIIVRGVDRIPRDRISLAYSPEQ